LWRKKTTPRHPSKAARTILTAPNQVKITSQPSILLILLGYLPSFQLAELADHRTAIATGDIAEKSALEAACIAFLGLLGPRFQNSPGAANLKFLSVFYVRSLKEFQIRKPHWKAIFASGPFDSNIRRSSRYDGMRMLESDH
jgi:hypothetical protein